MFCGVVLSLLSSASVAGLISKVLRPVCVGLNIWGGVFFVFNARL